MFTVISHNFTNNTIIEVKVIKADNKFRVSRSSIDIWTDKWNLERSIFLNDGISTFSDGEIKRYKGLSVFIAEMLRYNQSATGIVNNEWDSRCASAAIGLELVKLNQSYRR